jgi:hypothetical protein
VKMKLYWKHFVTIYLCNLKLAVSFENETGHYEPLKCEQCCVGTCRTSKNAKI